MAIVTILAPAAGARAGGTTTTGLPIVASLADARIGSLLLRDGEQYVEAPRIASDINITVSGPTSRARVTQIFNNPTKNWVEAIYVNPLPDGGAVDTLKMVIGDRIVVGEIKERVEAKVIYEAAKRSGRKATLIEQERPNIFTNSVANIGPGETVVVQIEYQEPVHRSGNTSSLRVPLVVAPRYNPAPITQTVDLGRGGWGKTNEPANDPIPDRDRITPPVLDPRVEPPTNPVAITVHLNAGFPLGEVKNHHHAVKIDAPSDDVRIIRLDNHVVPADRDFELTWMPAATAAPSVGMFRERVGNADYVLALVTPPLKADVQKEALPREMVFVIDNSGSMGGTSIAQAKASLLLALDRLKPKDRFNVIRFDHTMDAVFGDTVAADAGNIARAKAFVSALQASGGTEMVPPMKAALSDRRGPDSQYLRQVVFLTDGEIGNEQELIEKLESPIVSGLAATFSAGAMDATPDALPDLYRGEPIVVAAKLGTADGILEIKGMIGAQPWTVTLPVAKAAEGMGLSKLWARRKITDAEMAHRLGQASAEETDKRILALALEHHLVSRLTSLVAVDATPSRPEGARLTRAELPLNLPAGWDFDKVFGTERRGSDTPASQPLERRADAGNLSAPAKPTTAIAAAKALAVAAAQPAGAVLPKTATDAELKLMAGRVLLGLSWLL